MTACTAAEASQLFRDPPERWIDVGAGEVAYRRIGSGPDVLFVHGWPVSGATFRTLLPLLADHVTCHVIDFPGAGSSRFTENTPITVPQHIATVRAVIDDLGVDDLAVVGHDSGGLIARHAVVGDSRLRAMGLVNTEQSSGLGWRFRMFLAAKHAPGLSAGLGWIAGAPRVRRMRLVLGDAFADRSFLEGEFDEFFLRPLHEIPARRNAAVKLLKSFDPKFVDQLADIHPRIDVPVQMVWGDQDPFFPIAEARTMVGTFPDAKLHEVKGAGLFVHEERPQDVADALLPTLIAPGIRPQA
jgi:pimeloyl-ACP methyl ester carboxylesterase